MKKKIIGGIAALALVGAIAFNVNINAKKSGLSDVLLANIEALATPEVNNLCDEIWLRCYGSDGRLSGCIANHGNETCAC